MGIGRKEKREIEERERESIGGAMHKRVGEKKRGVTEISHHPDWAPLHLNGPSLRAIYLPLWPFSLHQKASRSYQLDSTAH